MAQPQSDDFDRLAATAGTSDTDLLPAGTETDAAPPSVEEQMAEIRKLAEDAAARAQRAEDEAGRLRSENDRLRTRVDSREAMGYRPAVDDGTGKPVGTIDELTKFLTGDLEENERSMPTAQTMVKVIAKAVPLFDQQITDRLVDHEKRKAMDENFFEFLANRWSTPQRTFTPKSLRTKLGDMIGSISREVLIDPFTRDVRTEYKNNADMAFTRLAEAVERRTNQIVEEVPRTGPPRQRLSTADGGGSRLATPAPPKDRELDAMYRHQMGR